MQEKGMPDAVLEEINLMTPEQRWLLLSSMFGDGVCTSFEELGYAAATLMRPLVAKGANRLITEHYCLYLQSLKTQPTVET